MDIGRLKLFVHTIKYLRFRQIYYRLYYFVRNRLFKKVYVKPLRNTNISLPWKDSFLYGDSYFGDNKFVFLNLSHTFSDKIDWNFYEYGKLWTYNLNYFDFLNQENISKQEGLRLIKDHIRQNNALKDATEPYPISLRGINWIKFVSKYSIQDPEIDQTLYNDYNRLSSNLEYHLLGNHLLENGYALFFGAYYFQNKGFYKKAKQVLTEELKEQILNDGGHFELSPMYHQILLHRLLDCINLMQLEPWKEDGFEKFLKEKAVQMLSWLDRVTFSNGNIPMVNDSTFDIAPISKQLFAYGRTLGLEWEVNKLSDSGYRKFEGERYELFVDVGNIGPKYQPGHAHADTFSFELYADGHPLIVDTGISTYEKDELRQRQRGTGSHNTVVVGGKNQTQVWGGFRVAKRAKIIDLKEEKYAVEATHNGYKNLGILHTRRFHSKNSEITISDKLSKDKADKQNAFLHFHPQVKSIKIDLNMNRVTLTDNNIHISFKGNILNIVKEGYDYARGFNRTEKAERLVISFDSILDTRITFL